VQLLDCNFIYIAEIVFNAFFFYFLKITFTMFPCCFNLIQQIYIVGCDIVYYMYITNNLMYSMILYCMTKCSQCQNSVLIRQDMTNI